MKADSRFPQVEEDPPASEVRRDECKWLADAEFASPASDLQIPASPRPAGVKAVDIDRLPVACYRKWLTMAEVEHEQYVDGDVDANVTTLLDKLRSTDFGVDIFTFAQKLPHIEPRHSYHIEWDNIAAIPITTYADWWKKRVTYDRGYASSLWRRAGLELRKIEINDAFIHGVRKIYNESPVRQGKPFFYYQWDFETVKEEQATYQDRSCIIGAYMRHELIGFIRMVSVKGYAAAVDVLSLIEHRRIMPNNALIAKAVEICAEEGRSHLIFGRYIYNNPASSLTAFKRRNGFEPLRVPRYYVPLTLKGAMALKMGLHRRFVDNIPMSWRPLLHRMRGAVRTAKF